MANLSELITGNKKPKKKKLDEIEAEQRANANKVLQDKRDNTDVYDNADIVRKQRENAMSNLKKKRKGKKAEITAE